MKYIKPIFVFLIALLFSQQAFALAILLGDPEQGGKINNERCMGCHIGMFGGDGTEIFTREDHKVKTIEGLMQQVEVCNVNTQKGELSAETLDDITAYLNEAFYKFDD